MTNSKFPLLLMAAAFLLAGACSQKPDAANNISMEANEPPPKVEVSDQSDTEATRQKSREQLREQARTDPDGADAEAIAGMSRNEVVATAINSAGFLCASVTDMYPSGGAIVVSCVENRNGSGRVKYRVDANAGRVEQLD